MIPEIEEKLNELRTPILPGNRQRPWEFPTTPAESAGQDILNYCPNYTTSTAPAPEAEQDEDEEEPITGTDRSLEIRCYNTSSSSIPPESFVEIIGAYPLGSDVVLLVTVPTEDALELAGITTTFLTPAGTAGAGGWCRIPAWAALRYSGSSGDYIGTLAGETHGLRGNLGSVSYVGDIEAGRAVAFLSSPTASGASVVKVTAKNGSGAGTVYSVQASTWDGTASGDTITDLPCSPDTGYLEVGDIATKLQDAAGTYFLVPLAEAVYSS